MHTPLIAGVLAMSSFMSLWSAAFFVRAWLVRRKDRHYLYFGGMTACVSIQAVLMALLYGHAIGMNVPVREATLFAALTIPTKPGLALLFHFALRFARVRRSALFAIPVYVLMAACVLVTAAGNWWAHIGTAEIVSAGGLSIHRWPLEPVHAARPFFFLFPVLLLASVGLMFKAWWARREGLAACLGAVGFGIAMLNDIAVGAGWFVSVPLFELGHIAFAYGVGLTLVARYGRAATALERRTEQLARRSGDLFQSYVELRRTQQELVRSEQLAVVGELAAVIAHEVRNPLAIVGNAVASLRNRRTTRADRKTLVEIIHEEMGRLDKLVSRLLNYARPVVPARIDIDLLDLAARSVAVAHGSPITVDVEPADDLPHVTGDPDLLRQAFENIISNAVQACSAAGKLSIRFSRCELERASAIAVTFVDDGEGMSAEACRQALSPFFTTRPTGTGLGLPIVTRIVEAHGGRLHIASEPGAGTTVTLTLPTRRDVRHARAARPARAQLLP